MLCLEIGRNFLGMQTESLSLKTVSLETDSQLRVDKVCLKSLGTYVPAQEMAGALGPEKYVHCFIFLALIQRM